jgi:hyperosmotically inducible protein
MACFLLPASDQQRRTTREVSIVKKLALGIALMASAGCATSQPIDTQASDALITSKIEAKLAADPGTNNFEIDVDTLNGKVRLRGMVETEAERREAEQLARNTEGVRSVDNQLRLGDLSGAENASDAWLVTKVESQLAADPEVRALDIDVDAVDGQVILSGVVPEAQARDEAERIARATEGVRSVRNEIRVR